MVTMGSRSKRDGRKRKLQEDSESDYSSRRKITDDEIAEYMVKKAQRKAIKVAKKLKGQITDVSWGYSNDSNPFGDSNLNESFVWRKKIEKGVYQGEDFSVKAETKRLKELMAEIGKVKKRGEERALQKAQHEQEMALLARERARAEFQDLEKKEDEFHYQQSKLRSEIRLRQGRLKPIDVLTKHYLNVSSDDDVDMEINEPPYMVFLGLTVKEMEEVHDDIKMHLEMERRKTQTHVDYWEALLEVCNWQLSQARKKSVEFFLAEERGMHAGIEADVRDLLEGKTSQELDASKFKIEELLSSGEARVVEYWQAVLKRLQIYKAKAILKEIHAKKMLPTHLKRLEPTPEVEDLEPVEETQEAEEEAGSLSPELLHGDEDEEEEAVDPEEDKALLEKKRWVVLEEQQRRIMASKPPADKFEMKAIKAMGVMEEGDAVFGSGAEVNLDSAVYYWWHDKYRPRKPNYSNRVHTGYEWNKYNQTHYNHDNPPPKMVQGYKFNIFYPDLVDKTKAPTYTFDKDAGSSDDETCIIRFHAGPPYEDIAFRIVNEEWESSHKKGFKCTFERGILHLYFNFKRHRYCR